jgi:hypothetical protein
MIKFRKRYSLISLELSALLLLILSIAPTLLHAQMQEFGPDFYYENPISLQKSGMIVLGTWAGLNIFSGSIGYFRTGNERKYFHQMNAAWNLVNLGIATFGYLGATNAVTDITSTEMIAEMSKFDRILLINAGLDLAYIGTGVYLWNRGLKKESDRLLGYGRSIVVQGAFLLVFDLILYSLHSPLTSDLMNNSGQVSFTGNGFRISF